MWDVLAIAPTDDPKAIRRAYAARLKQIEPDRDRETFARLRAALEWALARASQPPRPALSRSEPVRHADAANGARPTVTLEVVRALQALQAQDDVRVSRATAADASHTPPLPPPPPSAAAQERANERTVLTDLESALQRGDAREAWQLYVHAAAIGALPLGDTDRMLARLFTVALDASRFAGASFRELTKSLGWDRPDLGSPAVADVRERVHLRLAAEAWYDKLVAIAAGRTAQPQRPQAQAARVLLGRIRGRGLIGISRPKLRELLDQLKPHYVWLRDRIPPERVATLEQRYWRRELIATSIAVVFVGWLLLLALVALVAGSASGELRPAGGAIVATIASFLAWGVWRGIKEMIGRARDRPV